MFVEYLQEINPTLNYTKLFKAIVLDIWKNNFKKYDEQNERVRYEMRTLESQRQKVFDMHRDGIYSNTEFLEQKDITSKKIAQKSLLIQKTIDTSFNMDEALTYCLKFVENTSGSWISYKKDLPKRLRFQKFIFEDIVPFSGEKFGTAKLTPIYSIYQQYLLNPTILWTREDSNLPPSLCKSAALPDELRARSVLSPPNSPYRDVPKSIAYLF